MPQRPDARYVSSDVILTDKYSYCICERSLYKAKDIVAEYT